MKKNVIVGVGMLLALATMTGVLYAQANDVINANVPFQFTVGDKVIPKGEYEFFAADPMDPTVWTVRSIDGKVEETVATNDVDAKSDEGAPQTELVFDMVGEHHFLRQLWVEGELVGREIPASKAQRELEKQGTPAQQHHLPATHGSKSHTH